MSMNACVFTCVLCTFVYIYVEGRVEPRVELNMHCLPCFIETEFLTGLELAKGAGDGMDSAL